MRFAVISDIHANLEAFEAVLADARENKCTHFVCLGDVVGYNANPHECVERVREMDCPIVKGNHDEQASLVESSRDFNEMAEAAIQWTRDNLTDADKAWLRELKFERQVRDFTIVHATLDTPDQWGYVFNNLDAFPWLIDDPDRTLAKIASGYWVNFVKSGDPNGAGLPPWPSYRSSGAPVMGLDAQPKAGPEEGRERQAFLNGS